MLLRILTLASCMLYVTLVAWGAQAFENSSPKKGDTLFRGRVVAVVPDTSGNIVPIGGEPHISTAILPEPSLSYFLTDNIAVEGIIGIIPHRAKARNTALGTRDAGYIYALAPTVMLQYHKDVTERIKPYLGIGMAYVKYFEDDTVDQLQYKDDIAAIIQAGVDIAITDKFYANLDVKKIWADTEAKINGGAANAKVNFDPTIYGVGLGYKF
ncbi:MAG: OmpW family outer membrane protein [Rickettsiales bacterium]|nr:OmpW family outer membrane protein [Rickettsiales bacterium]